MQLFIFEQQNEGFHSSRKILFFGVQFFKPTIVFTNNFNNYTKEIYLIYRKVFFKEFSYLEASDLNCYS